MERDVANILQKELERRCRRNPRYSLRSFARTIGISPANLSLILNRKRSPSKKTVLRLLDRLELKGPERLILSETPMLDNSKENADDQNTDVETFEKISSWLSYAILSLTNTKGFRSDEKWIASRLGISLYEVRSSVGALSAAGLLNVKIKPWKQTNAPLRINNKFSTSITRKFQRELIEQSLQSLEDDPIEARSISSITFAMSPEMLNAAHEEIRRFRLRMSDIFEAPGESTEVYNLTVQLFPASKKAP